MPLLNSSCVGIALDCIEYGGVGEDNIFEGGPSLRAHDAVEERDVLG